MIDTSKYNGKPYILIGGDVCGIQNYIYQIVSKYAAKSLKGRSFYVHLLTDAIVRYMLDKLQGAELVYNAGGSFFIIAPKENETELKKWITNIENELWERHGISLYVAIASVDLDTQNIETNLSEHFAELFEKRDEKKFAKFANIICAEQGYKTFFEPHTMGDNNNIDEITGEYFKDGNDFKDIKVKDDDQEYTIRIRKITNLQIELGKKLKRAKYMTVKVAKEMNDAINNSDFNFLGYEYNFDTKDTEAIDTIDLNDEISEKSDDDDLNIKTFDKLCQSTGDDDFKRLGVLRMDVDNMGEKFQSLDTFDAFQRLSNSLENFFGTTLYKIKNAEYKDSISIIYSGGDDVFALGDWQHIMKFAEEVKDNFRKEFKIDGLTISAGVSLITLKFPIMKGAEYAGEEEKLAKAHNNEKNSISFLKMPLDWENEFKPVKELKKAIVQQCKETGERSFIQKILQRWSNAEFEDHNINNMATYWLLSYDIKRFCERLPVEKRSFYENCIVQCCKGYGNMLNEQSIETNYHLLELWALACRWAELELRCETA